MNLRVTEATLRVAKQQSWPMLITCLLKSFVIIIISSVDFV